MDSDYGIPRELSDLQKLRSTYQPLLPPCLQGTTVRVEFGDATTAADPAGAHTISRIFPHTYGQPLAHFLRETAKVPDAKLITDHPAIRVACQELQIQFISTKDQVADIFTKGLPAQSFRFFRDKLQIRSLECSA
ncbi:hypothetical protein CsSME_00036496 [Camellia sinensis var. sinensis]